MLTPPGGETTAADIQIAHSIMSERSKRSKTIRALADETGISYPALCQSLSGERSLSFNEFGRIAQALEVQPAHLLPDELQVRQVTA